jgi:hypothetical protein
MREIVKNFEVKIKQKEILRLLGHTSKSKSIKDSSIITIQKMIEYSFKLIKPKGIYVIKGLRALPEECLFDSAEKVAFCICTIGKGLEKKVKSLSRKGELGKAVILDAIGSVAAESTAEYTYQVIRDKTKRKSLHPSTRFSPGYGGWKLEGQKLFFDLLPADKIGVSLNKSFMMMPRKSVSFAVNLSKKPFRNKKTPCEVCGLKECRFKQ